MKTIRNILLVILTGLIISCNSAKYIHDSDSYRRQKELSGSRSASILTDGLMATISVASSVFFATEIEWYPTEARFKKMILHNPTHDTLYINMLTDVYWDTNNYCDFMDIRIPPEKSFRLLCPLNAEYNIYYSNTPAKDDDEMMTINTSEKNNLLLNPTPYSLKKP